MISSTYLELIRVYLSQELPHPYSTFVSIENADIVIGLPNSDQEAFVTFEYLYRIIVDSLKSIRNLDAVISVILRTKYESRSFQLKTCSTSD